MTTEFKNAFWNQILSNAFSMHEKIDSGWILFFAVFNFFHKGPSSRVTDILANISYHILNYVWSASTNKNYFILKFQWFLRFVLDPMEY